MRHAQLNMTAPPNTARQRTRFAPLRSPLGFRSLGVRGFLRLVWSSLIVLVVVTQVAVADSPLPPPAKYKVCSPNQDFCAVADPAAGSVSIFARDATTPTWSFKPWHRQVFLANDGDHLVIGPSGLNLIPLDTRLTDPLLVFMDRKAVVRVVSVGDLFSNLSSLRRTASHYDWGRVVGISARDQLIVQLVNEKRVAFNVSTGLVEAEK